MIRTACVAAGLIVFCICSSVFGANDSASAGGSRVSSRATKELAFVGIVSVQYNDRNNTNIRIKSQEVRNNRPSGTSGQLSIQCWAFSTPFAGQGGQTGYKLGQVSLGTLAAGSSIKAIDQTVPANSLPPDGTYYTSFLLVENNGTGDFFFDYINFAGTVVYTNGVVNVVSPPSIFVPSSTALAKQGAPFSYTFSGVGGFPLTFSATGLPNGLALKNTTIGVDESGVIFPIISGTPKTTGTFSVKLAVGNKDGTDSFTLSLTVAANSVNVSPTINSLIASPVSAITGQHVAFSTSASDPENAPLTYSWDFKDGTTLPGASVFHTFTVAGTYAVTLSVSDGVNTVLQSVNVTVTGAPTSDPFIDLVTADNNPVATNTPVTLTATAFSPANEALTYTWNFGDGTPTATGNPVTHTYTTKGEFSVSVTVQDVSLRLGYFTDFTMFVTDSSDPTNLVNGQPSVSPDGVQITVVPSPPGLLALDLAVTSPRGVVNRANVDFSTEFMIPGRQPASVGGAKPVKNVNRLGVVVATATGTDNTDPAKRLKGRKTIPVGAKDIGEIPSAPDTLTDNEKVIATGKLTGTFNFTSDKTDKVSGSFTIPLPAGYDLLRSQELSIGLSNVADRIIIDAKGRATGLADRGILQKVSIKYPHSGSVSLAGDRATINATFSAPNLDKAGFESDGITTGSNGAKTLQVAIVLAGIPYSGTVPVTMATSTKGDKAAVKLMK